jgi:hypothetical protein
LNVDVYWSVYDSNTVLWHRVQELDDLDKLIDKAAADPVDGPDKFDSFINAPKADVKVPPFNDSALVWWAHQPKLGGLRSMALDILGMPGEFQRLDF